MNQLSPFGPQNMKPVFMCGGLRDNGYGKKVGSDETHLKLNLFEGTNQTTYKAIGFGMGDKHEIIQNKNAFKAAFCIDENEWNGYKTLQLLLKDIEIEAP